MTGSTAFWRLSTFYLYYFALLGALLPFWGLYLQSQGFSLSQIGSLMAALMATKLLAPNLWGWLADKSGKRLRIIRIGALAAVFCFAGIFFHPGFWGMAAIMVGFSFFWNAILPQYEVITLQSLGKNTRWYSIIRSWGSLGFIFSVLGLGWYFEHNDILILPWIMFLLLVLIFISSLMTQKPPKLNRQGGDFRAFLRELLKTPVLLYFGICFLMQISHGPYYSFFSIYLEQLDYAKTSIAWLWSLGVIAEILVFLFTHKLFAKYSERALLMACLLITAIRWLLIGYFADNYWILFVAQLGHGASFGLFHALAIHCVHRFFSVGSTGQGQALYSAFSFGAGSALGAFCSGIIVEIWGMSVAYSCAAGVALLAASLGLLFKSGSITQSPPEAA